MAGAGFKTFNTGDVLTAADVNTYLMQQTVMVFASAAARTTALGANVAEGMLSYLKDTDQVEVYNGTSWVASDDPNAIQNTIVDAKGDLITATADNVPARIGVGTNGQVLTADSTTGTGLKWATPSSGATTWTLQNSNAADGNGLYGFAYNGSNLYVAWGANGFLYTSPDAKTWTSRTSGFGANEISKVIYANNLWVAVGQNGTLTTSSDGTTWTARTANMSTNWIYDVAYAGGNFVAVGGGGGATNTGGITYSTDGITWTRKSQTPTIGTSYSAVSHNGTNWIVGATLSTNNALYASSPSGTWTAFAIGGGIAAAVGFLAYDGTRTIAADNNSNFWVSTSTTFASWTQILLPSAGTNSFTLLKRKTSYYGGKIYITNDQYYQSFSTTHNNGIPTSLSTPDFVPALTLSPTTPSSFNNYSYCIMADAAGLLYGGSYQMIWTTF